MKKHRLWGFIFNVSPFVFFGVFLLVALWGRHISYFRSKESKNVITIALASDPLYLNPVLASDGVSMFVNSFIFNPLVEYDENLQIKPCLAKSWKIRKGGREIIFHLRQGVLWHDGTEFTAWDCVYTFTKITDPSTNTFNGGLFKIGEKPIKFEARDKYTLVAHLPRSFAPFFNNLTLVGIVPYHLLKDKDINRASFNRHPVGTGPFVFYRWKGADYIQLVKNEKYFRGSPKTDRIVLKIIPSSDGRRIALLSGQIDITPLTAEDLFVLKKTHIPKNIEILEWDSFTYYYFAFDLTNPLFKDVNVRKAINYAIDTKTITQASLHGAGSPLYGPIPKPSWAYTENVEKYLYDPSKARKILKNMGWTLGKDGVLEKEGKRFSFHLIYRSGSVSSETASVFIQSYLRDVGIEVKLKPLDFGALINSLYPNKFESVVFDWVEPMDPDIFTEWHSSQMGDVGMNFMSYSNKDVDLLLEKARYTFDREERKALYHKIQKLISKDAPYVFLWNQKSIVGVSKEIKGLPPPSPIGILTRPEKIWKE